MCDTRSYMQRKTNEAKTQRAKAKKIENHVADGATHRHHQQIIWINNKIPIIYEFISSWGSVCFFFAASPLLSWLYRMLVFFFSFWLLDPISQHNQHAMSNTVNFFFNEIKSIIMEENAADRNYKIEVQRNQILACKYYETLVNCHIHVIFLIIAPFSQFYQMASNKSNFTAKLIRLRK